MDRAPSADMTFWAGGASNHGNTSASHKITVADVMRSIELMGKEVIPALHEIKLQPYE